MGSAWLTSDGFARVCGEGLYVSDEPCAAVCGPTGCPAAICCVITNSLGEVTALPAFTPPLSAFIGTDTFGADGCLAVSRLYESTLTLNGYLNATRFVPNTGANSVLEMVFNNTPASAPMRCGGNFRTIGSGEEVTDYYGEVGTYDADFSGVMSSGILTAIVLSNGGFVPTGVGPHVSINICSPVGSTYNSGRAEFFLYDERVAYAPYMRVLGTTLNPTIGAWTTYSSSVASDLSSGSIRVVGTGIVQGAVRWDDVDIDLSYSMTPTLETCPEALVSRGVSPEVIAAVQSPDPAVAAAAAAQIRAMGISCCGG